MPKTLTEFNYDVFISYSHREKTWVQDELLPRLESAGLRVCIDYRDFRIGAPIVKEMERAVLTSRRTLLVLTPAYRDSAWADFEALMIATLDPGSQKERLLPLLLKPCDLPIRIKYIGYADFTMPDDVDLSWQRLLDALGAPKRSIPPPPLPPDTFGDPKIDPPKPRRSRSSVSMGYIIAIVGIVAAGLGVAFGYLALPIFLPPTCPGCAGFVIGRGYGCPANMEAVGSGASDRSCKDTFMLPSPTTTTQIRIDMTQRALKEFGYSLYEVEAYGPDDPTKNLLKDGNVAVSSTEEDRYVASNAADGDKTSRWASEKGRDPQWLEITLPQPARVNRIELRWEQAYATEYCVIVKPAQ